MITQQPLNTVAQEFQLLDITLSSNINNLDGWGDYIWSRNTGNALCSFVINNTLNIMYSGNPTQIFTLNMSNNNYSWTSIITEPSSSVMNNHIFTSGTQSCVLSDSYLLYTIPANWDDNKNNPWNPTTYMYIYDTLTNTFRNTSRYTSTTANFSILSCIVYYQEMNQIYVIGGGHVFEISDYEQWADAPGKYVQIYDITDDEWIIGPNLKQEKCATGCVITQNINDEDIIYVFGGDYYNYALKDIEFYPLTNATSWTYLASTLNIARRQMKCIEYNGLVYCMGGYGGND